MDLIKRMLEKESSKRITVAEIIEHSFVAAELNKEPGLLTMKDSIKLNKIKNEENFRPILQPETANIMNQSQSVQSKPESNERVQSNRTFSKIISQGLVNLMFKKRASQKNEEGLFVP